MHDYRAGAENAAAPYRRRATATPNRNATSSEPSGASRAMLLRMLRGMPGFRPVSMAVYRFKRFDEMEVLAAERR